MYEPARVSLFLILTIFYPWFVLGAKDPASWADDAWRESQQRQAYEKLRRAYARSLRKDPGSYDQVNTDENKTPYEQINNTILDEKISAIDQKDIDNTSSSEDLREQALRKDLVAEKEKIGPLPTTSLYDDACNFGLSHLRWVSALSNIARASSRQVLRKKPSVDTRLQHKREELMRSEQIRHLRKNAQSIGHIYDDTLARLDDDSLDALVTFGDARLGNMPSLLDESPAYTKPTFAQQEKSDSTFFSDDQPLTNRDDQDSLAQVVNFHGSAADDVAHSMRRLRAEYTVEEDREIAKWRNEDRILGGISALCVVGEDVHTLLGAGSQWQWKSAFALSNMAEYWLHGDQRMTSLPHSFEMMGLRCVHHDADFDKLKNDTLFIYHAQNFVMRFIPCVAQRVCSLCSYAPINEHLKAFCGYIVDHELATDTIRFAYDLCLPMFMLKHHFDFTMPQWEWYLFNNTLIYVVGKFLCYAASLAYDGNPYMLMLLDRYVQQVAPSLVIGDATKELIAFTRSAQYYRSREAFVVYHRTVSHIFEDTAFEIVHYINTWCQSLEMNIPSLPYLKESYYIYGMNSARLLFKGAIDYTSCIVDQQPETLSEVLAMVAKNRQEVDREERWRLQLEQLSMVGKY